ncbi:hypothetical protein O3P69_006069 [Scylla paramamosain]|uniref:Uncharacterized protein n=1 Tax=Scylla paramamosain TaxID=85552 RepID=A0AAW0U8A9_SCYPA
MVVEVRSGGGDLICASLPGVPHPGRLTPHHASAQRLLGSQSARHTRVTAITGLVAVKLGHTTYATETHPSV